MRFVLKRLALFVVALLGLSVVIFAALRILPGDVASVMAGVNSPPERVAQLREQLGLNRPSECVPRSMCWPSSAVPSLLCGVDCC